MANRQIFQHEEDLLLNDECKLLEDDANNKTKMFKLGTLKNFIAEFVKDKIKSWEYDSLKTEGKSIIESANEIYATTQKRMVSMEEIDLVTEAGFFVDALAVKELNRNLEATKNNLSGLQVLECGSKIITTPDGLYTLKGDLPEGRNYVAHVINGDYNANPAKIEKVIIQNNNVVVQFVGAVNNPYRINYVIFSVP
ncbi:hypothetical protein [[Clostridium] scindens]|uniref:hypothetical protein n=1 Tax=Clostridium scindens (strain JCM 10418 / VPI 12708) TaxID=29347 RepID=UPI00242EB599|nr:hypothetical protein [[Clostridium] scindens]